MNGGGLREGMSENICYTACLTSLAMMCQGGRMSREVAYYTQGCGFDFTARPLAVAELIELRLPMFNIGWLLEFYAPATSKVCCCFMS